MTPSAVDLMFVSVGAIVRTPVPRGAPCDSDAGHLAHEVPGAWLLPERLRADATSGLDSGHLSRL